MTKAMVKCKYCGEKFDRNNPEENFIKIGNRYAHTECAETLGKEDSYKQQVIDYTKEKLGQYYNEFKVKKNLENFINDGKTYENILKTLKYWYEVKGEDAAKSNGGIFIVNYTYDEALKYYKRKEAVKSRNQDIDMTDNIKTVIVKPTPVTKPKGVKIYELD